MRLSRYVFFCALSVAVWLSFIAVAQTETQYPARLWAPTYYIAAKCSYDGRPDQMQLTGASNLPAGAQLQAFVYNYIGEGGNPINDNTTVTLDKNGFFGALLHPSKGHEFRHNLVCDISFIARTFPPQPESVRKVVGGHGERLGFPRNPQAYVLSGENYYLSDLVHVP